MLPLSVRVFCRTPAATLLSPSNLPVAAVVLSYHSLLLNQPVLNSVNAGDRSKRKEPSAATYHPGLGVSLLQLELITTYSKVKRLAERAHWATMAQGSHTVLNLRRACQPKCWRHASDQQSVSYANKLHPQSVKSRPLTSSSCPGVCLAPLSMPLYVASKVFC